MYIMCVCLFSALSHRVGALQISIIIIIPPGDPHWPYPSLTIIPTVILTILTTILISSTTSASSWLYHTHYLRACIKTSAEDNLLREGWGCVNLMIFIWEFLQFGLTEKALFQVILGFHISVCRLRERGHMSKSVYVHAFHDLESLRDVLRCVIERQLNFPLGWIKYIVIVTWYSFICEMAFSRRAWRCSIAVETACQRVLRLERSASRTPAMSVG